MLNGQSVRSVCPSVFLNARGCQAFDREYSLILYPNLSVPLHHLPPVICMSIYMRPFPAGAWLRTLSSAAVFSDNKMTQRACGGVERRSIVSRSPQAHVFTLGPSHLMSQSRTPGIKNYGRINTSHNVRVARKGGGSHCVY